jgi:hypothetical protein
MEVRNYKGRTIDARAYPLRTGGWAAHFDIAEHKGSETIDTHFESGQVFESEKLALQAAVWMAARKIDSGYEPTFCS